MMSAFLNLQPERVFYYFEKISLIPRCSGQEIAISDYLFTLGKALGFETIQDKYYNVIIKKPPSVGYENSEPVILQGHMDMVCEKRKDKEHDFVKDGLKLLIEDDYIMADGTTLGADNGIALAIILAILEDATLSHPEIYALFTTGEETGMYGALGLEPTEIDAKRLINIDSEREGEMLVGCAGGVTLEVSFPLDRAEKAYRNHYLITISNLKGGHSGIDINEIRENAIKVLVEFLRRLRDNKDLLFLSEIKGGSKHNAIPRDSSMIVSVEEKDVSEFLAIFEAKKNELVGELLKKEPDIDIGIEELDMKMSQPIDKKCEDRLISLIELCPHGVYSMMAQSDIVESSSNLASIESKDRAVNAIVSLRSSKDSKLNALKETIDSIAKMAEGVIIEKDSYPAWKYNQESTLREVFKQTYRNLFGKSMNVNVIHAGLECGVFDYKFKDLDMVSIGPNIDDAHTPSERLSISSVQRIYRLLISTLANLK